MVISPVISYLQSLQQWDWPEALLEAKDNG
jgi:hypothetical protein